MGRYAKPAQRHGRHRLCADRAVLRYIVVQEYHELSRTQSAPEAALHYLIRFVAAKALVGYGMDIMLNIFSICNGVVSDMAAGMGGISQAMVALPGEVQSAIENVAS